MSVEIELKDDRSENVHYDFSDYLAYVRKGILSQYPNFTAVSHWHDDIELIAVLSGHMKYNINGTVIDLREGDGVFVNSRQLHYGFSEQEAECEFICVLLHPILLCATEQLEQKFIEPVLSNSSFSFWPLHAEAAWENRILEAIRQIYFNLDRDAAELQIQGLFYQIWLELFEHAPREKKQPVKLSHQLTEVRNMVGFIQKNYKEKITLEHIASAGNVCKSKCYTLFHMYLNQTPVNYLTNYRLKKSIELLADSDRNITEISYETGFTGTSYFSEIFRRNFGVTPTEYRAVHFLK